MNQDLGSEPAGNTPLTWSHGIKAWNWFCVQIVMFAGMKWDFHIRLTHLPDLASPETSAIDKILALNHASTCANSDYLPVLVEDLLHSTVLYNLQSCQPTGEKSYSLQK